MNRFKAINDEINICGMLGETMHTNHSFIYDVSVSFITTTGFFRKVVVSCRDGL